MKSGLYKKLYTNKNKDQEGVWFDYPDYANEDGTVPSFKMRRVGNLTNIEYEKALEEARQPYKQKIALDTMTASDHLAMVTRPFAEAIIVDWCNVQDKSGTSLPFSCEAAYNLLVDLPELFVKLNSDAQQHIKFQDDVSVETKN